VLNARLPRKSCSATELSNDEAVTVVQSALREINELVATRAAKMAKARTSEEVEVVRKESEFTLDAIRTKALSTDAELDRMSKLNQDLVSEIDRLNSAHDQAKRELVIGARYFTIAHSVFRSVTIVLLLIFLIITWITTANPSEGYAKRLLPWVATGAALFGILGYAPKDWVAATFAGINSLIAKAVVSVVSRRRT